MGATMACNSREKKGGKQPLQLLGNVDSSGQAFTLLKQGHDSGSDTTGD